MIANKLPDTVLIGGRAYPIRTDFRNGIRFTSAVTDKNLLPAEAVGIGIELFFGVDPHILAHYSEAVKALLYFYTRGKKERAAAQVRGGAAQKALYSFEQDETYIWAEFKMLGIDLETADLHWWKFCAMFERISTGIPYAKIIEYRAADLQGMDKRTAAVYKRMKQTYALGNDTSAESVLSYEGYKNEMKDYVARRFEDSEKRR